MEDYEWMNQHAINGVSYSPISELSEDCILKQSFTSYCFKNGLEIFSGHFDGGYFESCALAPLVEECIHSISVDFKRIRTWIHNIQEYDRSTLYAFPKGYLQISYINKIRQEKIENHLFSAYYSSFDKEFTQKIQNNFKPLFEKTDEKAGSVFTLISTQTGLQFKRIGLGGHELLKENYSSNVLSSFEEIVSSLNSSNPSGQLFIFRGPPGTGKTYILRALLNKMKKGTFVVIPVDLVSKLGDPSLVSAIFDASLSAPIVFLVEDADSILVQRKEGNVNALSTLLNFTDGILGRIADVRVICTTNATHLDFDEAITRPGRLGKLVEVDPLSYPQTYELYKKIKQFPEDFLNESFPKHQMTLAEIYALANDKNNGYSFKSPKKIGF